MWWASFCWLNSPILFTLVPFRLPVPLFLIFFSLLYRCRRVFARNRWGTWEFDLCLPREILIVLLVPRAPLLNGWCRYFLPIFIPIGKVLRHNYTIHIESYVRWQWLFNWTFNSKRLVYRWISQVWRQQSLLGHFSLVVIALLNCRMWGVARLQGHFLAKLYNKKTELKIVVQASPHLPGKKIAKFLPKEVASRRYNFLNQ